MSIASEIDQGTTVTIYLPRTQVESALPVSEDDMLVYGDRELILVVEDNPDVRDVSDHLSPGAVGLSDDGGGKYAREALRSAGIASIRELRSNRRRYSRRIRWTDACSVGSGVHFPEIPIVLATGYTKLFDSALEFPVLRKALPNRRPGARDS